MRRWARQIRWRLVAPVLKDSQRVDTAAFASFGERSAIEAPAKVSSPHRIHIGADVRIFARVWFSVQEADYSGGHHAPEVTIGDGTQIGHDNVIAAIKEITIGRDVLTADRVFISDTYHDYRDPATPVIRQRMHPAEPVRIEDGAFIGVNAVILPGVTIGRGAYVAASAVVTHDVPPHTVVAGNPAQPIRQWDPVNDTWGRPAGVGT